MGARTAAPAILMEAVFVLVDAINVFDGKRYEFLDHLCRFPLISHGE